MFDKNTFPHTPMHGTFVVIETIPDIRAIPSNQYYPSLFMPEQRVKFEYDGEVGSDWEDYFEYKMTVYPPYDPRMCSQSHWLHYCNEIHGTKEIPAIPVTQDLIMTTEIAKDEVYLSLREYFVKHGLKRKDFVYEGNISDGGASYIFYFKNWNTLISRTAYSEADISSKTRNKSSKAHGVIQILKRIDENARIPYRPMTK
ncbi:hypothetical protein [Delftia tsuruhatensis]|uniref:hypothetical protein n=1 Tax=Delftia tsuruhatensis TaxID=180282 RepID=UPI001F18F35E|nr:hypothetical protein [Delftia tsuruhatensis]